MSKPQISQKEFEDILKAWRQCRENHSPGRPFFMLVQFVPVGNGSGKVVCREVMSPVRIKENGK